MPQVREASQRTRKPRRSAPPAAVAVAAEVLTLTEAAAYSWRQSVPRQLPGRRRARPPEYIYTGFLPRTPWLAGATLQGVFGDPYDRPDLLPGHFLSAEFWTVHASFLIWGLAEAKAYETQTPPVKP